jgi:hypothetical protein
MAIQAVLTVAETTPDSVVDIKRYAKVEKIPGGELGDAKVLKGVMFQKTLPIPRCDDALKIQEFYCWIRPWNTKREDLKRPWNFRTTKIGMPC